MAQEAPRACVRKDRGAHAWEQSSVQTSNGSSSFQGNEIWSCCMLQSSLCSPSLQMAGLGEEGIEDTPSMQGELRPWWKN